MGTIREKAQCHVLIRVPGLGKAAIGGKRTLESRSGSFCGS
jgi:predicted DNA-binding helix-hairpin-helix protein